MSDRKANIVLLAKLREAQSKKPNPIRARKIKELEKGIKIGKAGPGDPISKKVARELMLKEEGKPKAYDPTGVLGMKIPKKKEKDWTKDYSKMWEKTGDPEDDKWMDEAVYKHGGRIKKPKKKAKAKPRKVKAKTRQVAQKPKGVRIALRGYKRGV
jgi:hypothetical protein